MNKQEAIAAIDNKAYYTSMMIRVISPSDAKDIINQIDEPQKVVIPQFVADWIEYVKKDKIMGSITYALYHSTCDYPDMEVIELWREPWENQEMIARAWLDGYEIKQEPLRQNRY